jgi:predicted DNA-binding transcriptional regulator AlpA
MRFLSFSEVDAKVGKKSRQARRAHYSEGTFPPPAKNGNKNAWVESEIDAYIHLQVMRRDNPELDKRIVAWLKREKRTGRNPWKIEIIDQGVETARAEYLAEEAAAIEAAQQKREKARARRKVAA